jgi:RNA methyltransferase, TrmH family
MLTKNRIKHLASLSLKKYREAEGVFLAEGDKIVSEMISAENSHLHPLELFATDDYLKNHENEFPKGLLITPLTPLELKKISVLSAPNKAVLLLKTPSFNPQPEIISNALTLALEDIRDPGNLGTIIRTADWFGIKDIFCSHGSVDTFNSKTIQSTMGAISRVRVHYTDLSKEISFYKSGYNLDIIGTKLNGAEIGNKAFPERAMIVFGNESHGISPALSQLLTETVKIPSFYPGSETSESLNVASSVAIMCWEIRRTSGFHSK